MAETANPSTADILAALPLVDNRISVAIKEVLRRLEENMPAAIDALNTQLGYVGSHGIKKPAGYHLAPGVLTDDYVNTILVGSATSTEDGPPRTFRNISQIVVYSIGKKWEKAEQVEDAYDRAGLIRGILYHFLTECEDADGHICWQELKPTGLNPLPESYAEYSGMACYFKLTQADLSSNNWQ